MPAHGIKASLFEQRRVDRPLREVLHFLQPLGPRLRLFRRRICLRRRSGLRLSLQQLWQLSMYFQISLLQGTMFSPRVVV
jgi:hypothetical protein